MLIKMTTLDAPMLLCPSFTHLGVVGDDLGDGADVRSTICLVFAWHVCNRVPRENVGWRRSVVGENTRPYQQTGLNPTQTTA